MISLRKHRKPVALAALLLFSLSVLLTGCWDSRELNELFIVTGVALDWSGDDDRMDITFQVGKPDAMASVSGLSSDAISQESPEILIKSTGDTVMEGMSNIDLDSSRTLLLQHNQVLLFGSALAQRGVADRLDLFLRNQETRMEELLVVVDGRADELLATEMSQDKISGMFLWRVMRKLAEVSPHYPVRIQDFVSRILEETTAPAVPIVTLVETEGKNKIEISGIAVFNGDRMIGQLNNDDIQGFLWAMGDVKQGRIITETDSGIALLEIVKLDCQREVKLRQDGGVTVGLDVDATAAIGELRGFRNMTPEELLPHLVVTAQNEIRREIRRTFEKARKLNADIYGIGTSVYRKYPGEWREMKKQWIDLFPETTLDIKVKVRIPSTGQAVESLEMEANPLEN